MNTLENVEAFRTEWAIYGEREQLAGTIDFVMRDARGELVLVDWKRCKQLRHRYESSIRMKKPIDHLPDCAGTHYRLQLNCYRYLLEVYYNYKVSGMRVVCTHPDNLPSAFVDEVPVMEKVVEALMQYQRRLVSLQGPSKVSYFGGAAEERAE